VADELGAPADAVSFEGTGAGREGHAGHEGQRWSGGSAVADAVARLELEVPEPEARVFVPREGLPLGGDALDAEGVLEKEGTVAVRGVEEPVPPVDEPVQAAASSPVERHASAGLEPSGQPAAHGEVGGERLSVDQEETDVRVLAGHVLGPRERVGPQSRGLDGPLAGRERPGGNGGKRQAGLGQEVRVPEARRPPGPIRSVCGGRQGRFRREHEEEGNATREARPTANERTGARAGAADVLTLETHAVDTIHAASTSAGVVGPIIPGLDGRAPR